ncbi:hypothetical protein DH86_00003475 [Scytalidium sp. 3C]|nr:hypothetical protein DH86_00003475 [Scytalidium sp. 3C]
MSRGKALATPYQEAVLSMLPTTKYSKDEKSIRPHESINDLPVHTATGQQIFWPTSESRHFTRADAAKVFDENLLPADDRVPHPELAIMERERRAGLSEEERRARLKAREQEEERKRQIIADRRAKQEAAVQKVDTVRWQFRIQDINVDDAGADGRGYKGIVTEILPPSTGLAFGKDARDLLIECCVEFITLISSEANEISEKESKKTIACEHITKALEQLGFSEYVPDILEVANEHKEQLKGREKKANKLEQSGLSTEELLALQEEEFRDAAQRHR